MKPENRTLLALLRSFMSGEKLVLEEQAPESVLWEEVYQLSRIHSVLPMAYEAAYRLPSFQALPEDFRDRWKKQTIATAMNQMQRTAAFLALYRKFNEAGLTVLVVKGILCRALYPKPDHRTSNDEDLFVRKQDFEACHRLLLDAGFVADKKENLLEEPVVSYFDLKSGLHLELHQQLFSEDSQAYGNFNALFANSMEKHIVQTVEGVKIAAMNHTDHMLFLICHSLKHFLHSGFGIRQVCDMVLYANTYGAEICWDLVMGALKQIHGDVFWLNLVDIGERYLGFSWVRANFMVQADKTVLDSDALLADIFDAGVFGKSSESRLHSSNITLHAYADGGESQSGAVLKTVFPSRKNLAGRYPVLNRLPVLLPVMWIHRLACYAMETLPTKGRSNSAAESVDIGRRRIELMKKYRIMK